MKKQYVVSVYLDTRRKKKKNLYPVKLRVYAPDLGKQKLYPTQFNFSKKDFNSIWETTKPRKEHRDDRLKIQAVEYRANDIADKIVPFTFEKFEKRLYRKTGQGSNVFYHYDSIIARYRELERIATTSNYELSKKSLIDFLFFKNGKKIQTLTFNVITPVWLEDYERFMLGKGKSRTTVAIYLRPLRAVFNTAINKGDVSVELYPFGRGRYQIPQVNKVKKALSQDQLAKLFAAEPKTPEQQKARDFWFLSYSLNGMNPKDIAMLRYQDIQYDKIVYYRAKKINTGRANLEAISVYLNDFSRDIILRYGNSYDDPKDLVFPILNDRQNAEEKHRSIQNFVRAINQNLKKLAKSEGLPEDISVYWARHSFATRAIRQGASMEFISEALNHSSMQTTQRYFAGFDDDAKRELSESLMNFTES
jgi:integrase